MSLQQEIENTFGIYNIPLQRIDVGDEVVDPLGAVANINPANFPPGFCYGLTVDGRWYLAVRVLHTSSHIPLSKEAPVPSVMIAYQLRGEDPTDWFCGRLSVRGTFGLVMTKIYEVVHCGQPHEQRHVEGYLETHTYAPY